ncbi:Leucine-rich repeat-containing protein 40 [Monoraphidium neglectum]|uniref:Leucine-rich repeat-containing protein 40 n=1 Tax=Monoraphidium neglectum TaxID=145388 RepID=A0A0D2MPR2_9CHLO|nr:Leucine-rich repeat-containing protein 40 [Monoraphidium neglectum]KIY96630.1 Leucine-rich repeat-containing protein 40 [Monoraphidium neglectum]|eukprot:XP_013895650.1 Leucine-rich repeat-containing protein 40 [Monoraphidium neglectum]
MRHSSAFGCPRRQCSAPHPGRRTPAARPPAPAPRPGHRAPRAAPDDGDGGPLIDERQMYVKLSIASSTGRIDLSDLRLRSLPAGLWEISDLHDLSVAGNDLGSLPGDLGALSELRRLVAAGNGLRDLPSELWGLTSLEGLWAHGNAIGELPEAVGQLTALKSLSLAGNRLAALPESLGRLSALQDLALSGNLIESLPPSVAALPNLKRLALNGNRLSALPGDWGSCGKLQELHLQGNFLRGVPDGFARLPAAIELSLADNQIARLPSDLSGFKALQKLHLYGNRLETLPIGGSSSNSSNGSSGSSSSGGGSKGLLDLENLQQLWLEGNPLSRQTVDELLRRAVELAAAGKLPPGLKAVGLDESQVEGADVALLDAALTVRPGMIRIGAVKGSGPGYFKLQRGGQQRRPAAAAGGGGEAAAAGERVLVVSFGSAPGLANWGGVLRKVATAMEEEGYGGWVRGLGRGRARGRGAACGLPAPARVPVAPPGAGEGACCSVGRPAGASRRRRAQAFRLRAFDVLFVVDPFRDWYRGGDPAAFQSTYHSRLEAAVAGYSRVVMVGDSMGATAALLFCRAATAVLAFSPQVDLRTASIRPSRPNEWLDALQQNLQDAVAASKARVRILTGTWQHDISQAALLKHHPNVVIKTYAHDDHRLALALARTQKLAPLLQEAISNEAGLPSKNVRLANLL